MGSAAEVHDDFFVRAASDGLKEIP